MFLLSAFIVGFLGSFHCAGMCGPIALALPVNYSTRLGLLINRLLYNGGRIITYSTLGIIAGLAGHRIALGGFQKALSISSGVLIIVIALSSIFIMRRNIFSAALVRYTTAIKKVFKKLFGQKSHTTLFLIGLVNGLLPCGFVYIALAAAIGAGTVINSAAYMVLFGLGTLPVMLFISLSGNFVGLRFNKIIRQTTPYVALIVAGFLIARGMMVAPCCHH